MRFSSPYATFSILHASYRCFSSNIQLPNLSKIHYKLRSQAIQEAQEVLTDYLHTTRALPFTYAENISKNSIYSLSELISEVHSSPSDFRKSLLKFLRYNPINEFGFFYESIGVHYLKITSFLKPNVHFFSDDSTVLDAACALAGFGFPWDKLGRLYEEEVLIFEKKPEILSARLNGLLAMGFNNQQVLAICLAFPYVLKGDVGLSGEIDALLNDLKKILIGFCLGSSRDGNMDVWYEVCRKMKLFYDLGVEKGKVGDMMDESKLIDYPLKVLVEKIEFFCRLGVEKTEFGLLLLRNPEIFDIEFDNRVISVLGFLNHFGVQSKKLKSVAHKYSYVFGRHKMVDLPHALRAMDLHEWFFNRIKCGNSNLLATYDLSSPDDGLDENYVQNLEKIKSSKTSSYTISKLNFLHGIGFGENSFTMKILANVHGSASDLQERFDYLLHEGIEFSKLCKIISFTPKILNQETNSLKRKLDFLRQEIGLSLEYLETFPAYLMYNLDKRVRPRYKFRLWLTEQGWCKRKYSLASIIAISEKGFLAQLSCIHPTAPQLWRDYCAKGNKSYEFQKTASLNQLPEGKI